MLYYLVLFMLTCAVSFILKAIYYGPRPYVINESVAGCECDPGMPSAHASITAATYWITYELIDKQIIERSLKAKQLWEFISAFFCFVITVLVIVSRVTLGAHSYSQLIVGLFIGLALSTVFTVRVF